MPEVITGISLLMLFIYMAEWIGWPGSRGFTTITIAHTTFSMTYVATVVQSRLSTMDVAIEGSGDGPWCEALARADRRHAAGHRPAILAGWLLAFTISLDDVVITNFTTVPAPRRCPS